MVQVLAPVMQLKSRRDIEGDDIFSPLVLSKPKVHSSSTTTTMSSSLLASHSSSTPSSKVFNDYDWDVVDEYDPLWPNEYEKLIKERRSKDTADKHGHKGRGGDSDRHHDRKRKNTRFEHDAPPHMPSGKNKFSGFAGRPDEEEDYQRSSPPSGSSQSSRGGGAAIAPPPSLQESTPIIPAFANMPASGKDVSYGSNSVAAKIMAKYGFKVNQIAVIYFYNMYDLQIMWLLQDGQGLGKQEQGMAMALQVEKTSKRGGRIVHERDSVSVPCSSAPSTPASNSSPPPASFSMMPPPAALPLQSSATINPAPAAKSAAAEEPTITEIMKAPSKVVLLRNMVGPGDVDSDLEPEVKDECNTKYGDVVSCVINELKDVMPEEAVRIFVEFKRIESAIKGRLLFFI